MDTTLGGKLKGRYSEVSLSNYSVVQHLIPLALDAIDTIPFNGGDQPFVICEYGCADGGVTLGLIKSCIDIISQDDNITVYACAKTFYKQCLDNNTVHIGISSTAFHWLSNIPCDVPDAIYAGFSNEVEVKQKFHEQAARDWELLLEIRHRELVHGGQLVIAIPGSEGDKASFSSHPDVTSVFELINDVVRETYEENLITKSEYGKITIKFAMRSTEDCTKPFKNNCGFEVLMMFHKEIPCEYFSHEKGNPTGESISTLITAMKMVFYRCFIEALNTDRSCAEKNVIVDHILEKASNILKLNPDKYMETYDTHFMQLKKT